MGWVDWVINCYWIVAMLKWFGGTWTLLCLLGLIVMKPNKRKASFYLLGFMYIMLWRMLGSIEYKRTYACATELNTAQAARSVHVLHARLMLTLLRHEGWMTKKRKMHKMMNGWWAYSHCRHIGCMGPTHKYGYRVCRVVSWIVSVICFWS